MKRLLTYVVALLMASVAYAGNGLEILDRAVGHRVVLDYSYSLLKKDAKVGGSDISGTLVVQDNSFILNAFGLKIISDGTTRWSIDEDAKEVLVESVDKEDWSSNPALIISSWRNISDKIHLNSSSANSLDMTLELDEKTSARFVLRNIVFQDLGDPADFSLPSGVDESNGYIITDMR